MQNGTIQIYSVFNSIDGEINQHGQGAFSTFIRFAGCNLQCGWCDTKYAQDDMSGTRWTIDEIVTQVLHIGCKRVTITGGEPLMQQKEFIILTQQLWHKGCIVTVETNGSYPLEAYGVLSWVVDYKLPSSGMMDKMNLKAFNPLGANDFIKFVIANEEDYDTAVIKAKEFSMRSRAKILFSPCMPLVKPKHLIQRMKNSALFDYRVNLQLHKLVDIGEAK